jgi:YVTN family beta-propeller protein
MLPRRAIAAAASMTAGAVLLAACGGGSGGAGSTSSTSSLPPLPPTVKALVALAGSGNNLGYGSTVVPIDLSGGTGGGPTVGRHIHVGTYPDAIAVNPAGTMAYVANYTSNNVTPINLATDRPEPPIPAGIGPAGIAITPNGKMAYVTDDGSSSTLGNTVTPINLRTGKPGRPITVGSGPQGIVITPDGSTAYVADAGAIVTGQSGPIGNTVTPINLASRRAEHPITVGNGPTGMAITPDGSTVFVTNLNSGSVSPISTAANTAGSPIAVPGGPVAVTVAKGAAWVVDAPSGTSPGSNVTPISINTDRPGAPIVVPKGAQAISVAPNGKVAWVACLDSNMIVAVNLVSKKLGRRIVVTGGPFAVAVVQQSQGGGGPSSLPPTTHHKKKHHKKTR